MMGIATLLNGTNMSENRYVVSWTAFASKDLKKLDASAEEQIINAVEGLKEDPLPSGVKKIKSAWRLRVNRSLRVLYAFDTRERWLAILAVGQREGFDHSPRILRRAKITQRPDRTRSDTQTSHARRPRQRPG